MPFEWPWIRRVSRLASARRLPDKNTCAKIEIVSTEPLRIIAVIMLLKTFKFRLFPSPAQRRRLEDTLETCRRWYNTCLAERKSAWEQEHRRVGKYEQLRKVKEYRQENEYAAHLHSHILQVVVQDLDKAFQAFFRRVKKGESPGHPRFKGQHRIIRPPRWHLIFYYQTQAVQALAEATTGTSETSASASPFPAA